MNKVKDGVTNLEFSKSKTFIAWCKSACCNPTSRQASKFRSGKGIVKKVMLMIASPLKKGDSGYFEGE